MNQSFAILGIDPGKTTGLALLLGTVTQKEVRVGTVRTFYTLAPSAFLIDMPHLTSMVVMEQKPAHPSKDGETAWDLLYHGMLTLGYGPKHLIPPELPTPGLHFVSPGQWKPFMKSRARLLPRIENTNRHSMDAWKMTHYLIQRIYPTKEICYE